MHPSTTSAIAHRRMRRHGRGARRSGTPVILVAANSARATAIDEALQFAGYNTVSVRTGGSAVAMALDGQADLLVLDHDLPDIDGLTVMRALRGAGGAIPVVAVSADESHAAQLLDHGADDFLAAPFHPDELAVRIKLRLRPAIRRELPELSAGPLTLELESRRCRVGGRTIDLTHREFVLAEVFCRHPRQVLSREQLVQRAWGPSVNTGSNVIDVYIGYLRRKLGPEVIETVRGVGYRLARSA